MDPSGLTYIPVSPNLHLLSFFTTSRLSSLPSPVCSRSFPLYCIVPTADYLYYATCNVIQPWLDGVRHRETQLNARQLVNSVKKSIQSSIEAFSLHLSREAELFIVDESHSFSSDVCGAINEDVLEINELQQSSRRTESAFIPRVNMQSLCHLWKVISCLSHQSYSTTNEACAIVDQLFSSILKTGQVPENKLLLPLNIENNRISFCEQARVFPSGIFPSELEAGDGNITDDGMQIPTENQYLLQPKEGKIEGRDDGNMTEIVFKLWKSCGKALVEQEEANKNSKYNDIMELRNALRQRIVDLSARTNSDIAWMSLTDKNLLYLSNLCGLLVSGTIRSPLLFIGERGCSREALCRVASDLCNALVVEIQSDVLWEKRLLNALNYSGLERKRVLLFSRVTQNDEDIKVVKTLYRIACTGDIDDILSSEDRYRIAQNLKDEQLPLESFAKNVMEKVAVCLLINKSKLDSLHLRLPWLQCCLSFDCISTTDESLENIAKDICGITGVMSVASGKTYQRPKEVKGNEYPEQEAESQGSIRSLSDEKNEISSNSAESMSAQEEMEAMQKQIVIGLVKIHRAAEEELRRMRIDSQSIIMNDSELHEKIRRQRTVNFNSGLLDSNLTVNIVEEKTDTQCCFRWEISHFVDCCLLCSHCLESKERDMKIPRTQLQAALDRIHNLHFYVSELIRELKDKEDKLSQICNDLSSAHTENASLCSNRIRVQEEAEKIEENYNEAVRRHEMYESSVNSEVASYQEKMDSATQAVVTVPPSQLAELRSLQTTPPPAIRVVLEALAVMMGTNKLAIPTWEHGIKAIRDPGFRQRVLRENSQPVDRSRMLQSYLDFPRFYPADVKQFSRGAATLCRWIRSTAEYVAVRQRVQPQLEQIDLMKSTCQSLENEREESRVSIKITLFLLLHRLFLLN